MTDINQDYSDLKEEIRARFDRQDLDAYVEASKELNKPSAN